MVTILVNGRPMTFEDHHPIAKLLILEAEDYEHSIAPDRVVLEFEGYSSVYELPGCPRCLNEKAKKR